MRRKVACGSSAFRSLATACHIPPATVTRCALIAVGHGRVSVSGSRMRQDCWLLLGQDHTVVSAIPFVLQMKADIVSVMRQPKKSKKPGATILPDFKLSVQMPCSIAMAALRNAAGMDGRSHLRPLEASLLAVRHGGWQ